MIITRSINVIAFDFGTKSIGVAIGQCEKTYYITRPLTAYPAQNGVPNWSKITSLIKEWCPEIMVIGLPLNMDGSTQPITKLASNFAHQLHQLFGLQIFLHDERLSTIEARADLFTRGGYRALTKIKVDTWSAVIILDSWFQQFIHSQKNLVS